MGTVLLIALGLLCFVTGPALALVIVLAVRGSARGAATERRSGTRDAARIPVTADYGHRR
ncbi:hypothetical protein [Nocardia aurantiaca]|uniref:Uncharacterized protein n=1 Tax=Nocardia aurantiaca TaxID=2675850 RepID=A0A6I3KXX5_9NOCA|nr:hypothetical protein [Nocardia aurantiaca]MTE12964.1 hypothetical protein [Nocardia aurantiaca]